MKFKILWIPIVIPANSEEDNNTVRSRQIAEVLPHHLRSLIVFETPPELRVQPKPLLHWGGCMPKFNARWVCIAFFISSGLISSHLTQGGVISLSDSKPLQLRPFMPPQAVISWKLVTYVPSNGQGRLL